ncbi:hypothetical protein [Sporomusa sp. KB1]|jgi:ATP-dependent DNA helicase RecG|nr:hypothetical protein [Sporomusa sp. KB1]
MPILEGPMVELKQTVVDDVKKEVVAFANSEGGIIYIYRHNRSGRGYWC